MSGFLCVCVCVCLRRFAGDQRRLHSFRKFHRPRPLFMGAYRNRTREQNHTIVHSRTTPARRGTANQTHSPEDHKRTCFLQHANDAVRAQNSTRQLWWFDLACYVFNKRAGQRCATNAIHTRTQNIHHQLSEMLAPCRLFGSLFHFFGSRFGRRCSFASSSFLLVIV